MRLLGTVATGALFTALTTMTPGVARAQSCPVPEGASPALASVEPSRRLSFVTGALETAGAKSDRWGGFWRVAFQTSAAVHFSLAHLADNDATRVDLIAGGVKSTAGFLFAAVLRLPAERHYDAWADRPWEEGDVCTRLAAAEAALEKDAKFEQRARSIGMHALGISFNIGVGVAAYLVHRRLWSVVTATLVGGAVGETRIFTTPTVATEALADYRGGKLGSAKVAVTPIFLPQPGGGEFALALTF